MKNFTICFVALFSFSIGTSQIYVKNNSSIFVKNTVLYAKGNLELNGTNSNLYLRNEGQFLQGTTGSSANVGTGKLSVFQEGTSDNYEYNYWCSPVGSDTNPAGGVNGNFDIGMLYSPSTNTVSTQAATTGSYNGVASPLAISNYWIWTFRASGNYADWFHISNMPSTNLLALKAGEGFTMKGTAGNDTTNPGETTTNNPFQAPSGPIPLGTPSSQRYDFRGKPNDGTINIAVLPPVGAVVNSTLTGNPYPSAINLNYFLLENSGFSINYSDGVVGAFTATNKVIDGNAYFWEQNKSTNSHNIANYEGGYGVYAPNGTNANTLGTYNKAAFKTYNLDGSIAGSTVVGGDYKRMFSPVGQGFMVNGFANGSPTNNAVMKNVYRVFRQEGSGNNSEFERNSNNSTTNSSTNWDDIPNVAGVDYTQFSKLEVPQIKVRTVLNDLYTKEVTIAFNPNATDGYDTAMEALSMDDFSNDINLSIVNNTNPFVITTLPFAMEKRIPVTLKSAGVGTFKIKVDSFINFNETNTVYLYDNITNVYHNIVGTGYEFSLPNGIYSNRFEITFQDTALSTPTVVKNNFVAVQNNNNQLLSISNPNSLDVQSVVLYDISGKQIFNKVALGAKTTYEFPTATLSDGVYIVSLKTTDNQSFTQKIIVKSSN